MKYENKDLVINLLDQIRILKEQLEWLKDCSIVKLCNDNGYSLLTINFKTAPVADYSKQGYDLLNFIKSDLSMRIAKLKDQLSEL